MPEPPVTMDEDTVSFGELALFVVGLARAKAYGEVTIKLQKGQISTVRFLQQFKPGQLPFADKTQSALVAELLTKAISSAS